jgi:hypothetical protein
MIVDSFGSNAAETVHDHEGRSAGTGRRCGAEALRRM